MFQQNWFHYRNERWFASSYLSVAMKAFVVSLETNSEVYCLGRHTDKHTNACLGHCGFAMFHSNGTSIVHSHFVDNRARHDTFNGQLAEHL